MMSRRRSALPAFAAGLGTAVALSACAGLPQPPAAVPRPLSPEIALVRYEEPLPRLAPARPLAPELHWTPAAPQEGTIVALTLDPDPRGLPLLEARLRTDDTELALAALPAGGYLAFLAAPRSTDDVGVQVTVAFVDGTRLRDSLSLPVARRDFPFTRLRVARRFTAPDEPTLQRIQRERELLHETLRSASPYPLWTGPFIRPLEGPATSPYGQRRLFNNEVTSQHTGLDIDADTGDPVRAANSGRVALSRSLFFNGQAVFIDHGLGVYTGYFHLSKREVSEGQWVKKGELIGRVGSTGRVTGPHLHWALYVNGVALDPLSLLEPEFARLLERVPVHHTPPAPLP